MTSIVSLYASAIFCQNKHISLEKYAELPCVNYWILSATHEVGIGLTRSEATEPTKHIFAMRICSHSVASSAGIGPSEHGQYFETGFSGRYLLMVVPDGEIWCEENH
jgi:hypothetical protein